MDNAALEQAKRSIKAELTKLYAERDRLDHLVTANNADIVKHEAGLNAMNALLGNPSSATEQLRFGGTTMNAAGAVVPQRTDQFSRLLQDVPRQGYGVISKGVSTLLESYPDGFAARDLTEILTSVGFHLNGVDKETPVRSALKNLRLQHKVVYDSDTGHYRLAKKAKPPAGTGSSANAPSST